MRALIPALLFSAFLPAQDLRLTQVAQGISSPTDIQGAGDGSGRIFLVEQAGVIKILRGGTVLATPFLDIRSKVASGGERGLLGLAFPPGFADSQRFYVNYTNLSGHTVIAQYRVQSNRDLADSGSETILLTINQPFANHNGGQLRFGPDGYLYIGMGDGGNAGDPQNNAQNMNSLLGKMLRVDVESQPGSVRIPADNPFVNTGGARPEIWAFGLRNPWRFSFDAANGDLWIGDVGQNQWEEINFQPASSRGGENYGWPLMEGAHCFRSNCSSTGLTFPVAEYSQSEGGCSVTGGFVYRGQTWPTLRGVYLYGDYCSGRIWGIERSGSAFTNRLLLDTDVRMTTFGQDDDHELYLANAANGRIFRIDTAGTPTPRFSADGVVNAASFAPGVTPGSLATLFGAAIRDSEGISSASSVPLPKDIDGVSVKVAGFDAPVLSVSNVGGTQQVNFQVPFEVSGRSEAEVVLARSGMASEARTVTVRSEQPGVFVSSGTRGIAVHNSNYTLATDSAPLAAGETAFVYATGLGAVTNAPSTGAAGPTGPLAETRAQIRARLGGQNCDITFVGLAPGFVGVYQVNFRVPSGAGSGLRDFALTAGTADAPVVQLPLR